MEFYLLDKWSLNFFVFDEGSDNGITYVYAKVTYITEDGAIWNSWTI